MSDTHAFGKVQKVEIEAIVFRADGTVEDLGTIAVWHRNPLRRLASRLRRLFPGA